MRIDGADGADGPRDAAATAEVKDDDWETHHDKLEEGDLIYVNNWAGEAVQRTVKFIEEKENEIIVDWDNNGVIGKYTIDKRGGTGGRHTPIFTIHPETVEKIKVR